jgi:hypothetical protein
MSPARAYRRFLLRVGEASLNREIKNPRKRELPTAIIDVVILGLLVVNVIAFVVIALCSWMAGSSVL